MTSCSLVPFACVGRRVRSIAETALRRSPAQIVFRRRAANRLAVLAYHSVDEPRAFDRQLDYLVRSCTPVSLDAVRRAVLDGGPLPARPVLITFDDADRTILEHALPLLRDRRVPAIAFVVAGHLDGTQPFWWEEVAALMAKGATSSRFEVSAPDEMIRALKLVPDDLRLEAMAELRGSADAPVEPVPQLRTSELAELIAGGVQIGNHSLSHPCLPRCRSEKLATEIRESHEMLTRAIGYAPAAFAYPNGDYDERVLERVRAVGYDLAFGFDHRIAVPPFPDRLRISRVRVSADASVDRLATLVSGLHPSITHALGRAN